MLNARNIENMGDGDFETLFKQLQSKRLDVKYGTQGSFAPGTAGAGGESPGAGAEG